MSRATARMWAKYAGAAFGAALLAIYVIYFLDPSALFLHVRGADGALIALSAASFCFGTYVRCLKWTYIVRISAPIPWSSGVHVMLASNMLNFLFPLRMGEIARLYLSRRVASIPYAISVSATLIDRISGFLVLMLAFSLYPIAEFAGVDSAYVWGPFGVVAAISAAFLLLGEQIARRLPSESRRLLSALGINELCTSRVIHSRLMRFVVVVLEACYLPRYGWGPTFVVFSTTLAFTICDAISMYFLLIAFDLPLSFIQAVVSVAVFNFAFVLPSPPAQIGTADLLPVLVYSFGFGLPRDVVASSALLWHVLSAILIIAAGLVSTYVLGARTVFSRDRR